MTECHSVPSEGSTTQCDAGQSEAEGYDINGKVKTENGNLRVSKSRSMVGTRHAVSDNKA